MATDLVITINNTIQRVGVASRELQVLSDGLLSKTIDLDVADVTIPPVSIDEAATITIELRDVEPSGAMSAPLIHEFVIVDGVPKPQSDIFHVEVRKG